MYLCQHDYSEFDGDELNEHGLYEYRYLDHYWTEADRYPYLIKVAGKIAGFVLVRDMTERTVSNPPHSIAEFFIVRKYRRQGVGKAVAKHLFDDFPPGNWVVGQSLNNIQAQEFWRRVVSEYTSGEYVERQDDEYNVFEFRTKS